MKMGLSQATRMIRNCGRDFSQKNIKKDTPNKTSLDMPTTTATNRSWACCLRGLILVEEDEEDEEDEDEEEKCPALRSKRPNQT
jgi:hypothetical protein